MHKDRDVSQHDWLFQSNTTVSVQMETAKGFFRNVMAVFSTAVSNTFISCATVWFRVYFMFSLFQFDHKKHCCNIEVPTTAVSTVLGQLELKGGGVPCAWTKVALYVVSLLGHVSML